MADAAARAAEKGVRSMVGFTYRRVPAATFARDLVAAGRIGEIRQVRAAYLQDWLMDAEAPLTWRHAEGPRRLRMRSATSAPTRSTSSEYITGLRLQTVSGILDTIVAERPLLAEGAGLSGTASSERGAVTVDDVALFTGRYAVRPAATRPSGPSRRRASRPAARTR